MKTPEFIKKLLGLVPEDQRAALEAEVAKLEPETPPATPPATSGAPSNDPAIAALQQQLAASQEQTKQVLEALQAERAEREKGVAAQQEIAQKQRTKEIGEVVDAAIRDGRIPADKKETWQKRLEADFDGYKETIADLPPNAAVAKSQQQNGEGKVKKEGGSKEEQTVTYDRNALLADAAAAFTSN